MVDQRVAEIKQDMNKENEERIQEINVLSANVSDVLERREHLINLEAEINRCRVIPPNSILRMVQWQKREHRPKTRRCQRMAWKLIRNGCANWLI